jgi:hypothetical protein
MRKTLTWFNRRGRISMPRAEMVEVPDTWSLGYDGSPLLLDRRPQLGTLLSSPSAMAPFDVSGDEASSYWNDLDLATQRRFMASAYLRHPDGEVRRETLAAVRELDIDLGPIPQELADVLLDELPAAREEAARLIRERRLLGFAMRVLRDEIVPGDGHAQYARVVLAYRELARTARVEPAGELAWATAEAYAKSDHALSPLLEELLQISSTEGIPGASRERTRELGLAIFQRSGHHAMLGAHSAVNLVHGRPAARHLEMVWDGVGRWRG